MDAPAGTGGSPTAIGIEPRVFEGKAAIGVSGKRRAF